MHIYLACNCEDVISIQVHPNENISFLYTKKHVIILSFLVITLVQNRENVTRCLNQMKNKQK